MRKYMFLAAAAATAIASPALARDGSPYVGIDAGIFYPESKDINGNIDFSSATVTDFGGASIGTVRFDQGYDVDLNAGYDFGMFRVEGELGYKHAKVKDFNTDIDFFQGVNSGSGNTFQRTDDIGFGNKVSVLSGMINGMFEIGDDAGWSGFAGGGLGYAHFKELGDSDSSPAWQAFAGVRARYAKSSAT